MHIDTVHRRGPIAAEVSIAGVRVLREIAAIQLYVARVHGCGSKGSRSCPEADARAVTEQQWSLQALCTGMLLAGMT